VLQIRRFKPDVIINRFPPDSRAGHGHHSASAVLSAEAFDAAADPKRFPEQLKEVDVWQAKRLVWNSFTRGFTNEAPTEKGFVKLSLGDFNPLLGKSYQEIAAEARSKHRSQGFGSAVTRNERFDYALHVKGDTAKIDLFDAIDLSWNRVSGGHEIDVALGKIIDNYEVSAPSKSVKGLIEVYKLIDAMPKNNYQINKKTECLSLIMACAGLYFEANPSTFSVSPGQKLTLFTTAIKRSNLDVKLSGISFYGVAQKDTSMATMLTYNKALDNTFELEIPSNTPISQPYWLNQKPEKGIYSVDDFGKKGMPMAPDPIWAAFDFEIEGSKFVYQAPVKYKYTEPSLGEIYKYLEIRPEIMLGLSEKVYIFSDKNPKKITVNVMANVANVTTHVSLKAAEGWKVTPENIEVTLEEKNKEKNVSFWVTPPLNNAEILLKATANTKNGRYDRSIKSIKYEHIPALDIFPEAVSKAKRLNIERKGQKIGYIAGAGDEVPEAIKQMGYEVTAINEHNILNNLALFDAIIVGVRAYNTEDWLVNAQDLLLKYVFNGGTLIVQYQTQAFYGRVKTKDLGPYALNIGRGRVTDENAEMKILKPTHPILTTPNKISSADFQGWVQERGLYFADKWSDKYQALFSIKDEGETEQEGALLYAPYGKGHYVFTGLSFFRQLPAGVPGAYKLMSNLISIGKK
jgi:hypothetical protein